MRPTIIVDANPIVSALIGGFSREVLFNHYFVHQGISLEQYYYMILALVAMVFAVVLFILPLFEEKKL